MTCVFHERPFMRRHMATWARLSTTLKMHNRRERHMGREAVGARVDGGFSGRFSLTQLLTRTNGEKHFHH